MTTQLEAWLRVIHLFDQLHAVVENRKPLNPVQLNSIEHAFQCLADRPALPLLKRQLRCVEASCAVGAYGAAIVHMRQAQALLRRVEFLH